MNKKKPIFLTDGKSGIFKLDKLIRAAQIKNLETGEIVITEIIGSNISGFAIIDMPKIAVEGGQSTTAGKASRKIRKGKSSKYWGVGLSSKGGPKPWRTSMNFDGKNISVGCFADEITAAKAVDAELERRGKPKRNFP